MKYRVGIGQDSHRFLSPDSSKPCVIGGVIFDDVPGLNSNSDGDVIFHAICNAISSLTHVQIIGELASEMLVKEGITDSERFLQEAAKTLAGQQIVHIALSVEAKKPPLKEHFDEIRENVARVLEIQPNQVGITANSGEGLTDFGCGDGIQCFAIITTMEE